MEEGVRAPERRPIKWRDPGYWDEEALDQELRRVFDICHGCRRCFALCDSFPRLFALIDESQTGELDSVDSKAFKPVVDACTLCDMCFMVKCPYVPPHSFDLDFPHLMLRYRAVEARRPRRARRFYAVPGAFVEAFLSELIRRTDTLGKANGLFPRLVNLVLDRRSRLTRWLLEQTLKIDRHAVLPRAAGTSFLIRMRELYVESGRPVAGTSRFLGPQTPEAPVGPEVSVSPGFSPDPEPAEIEPGPLQPSAGSAPPTENGDALQPREIPEGREGLEFAETPPAVSALSGAVPASPPSPATLSRAAGAHVGPTPSREELPRHVVPRHVVFYTSCYGNYNEHHLGEAALYVLAHYGVEVEILYDECCGMPQLEGGELEVVSQKAQRVASRLEPWIDRGYAVVAPVPSCSLMFKKEWALLVPEDKTVAKLAKASYDLSEYIVALAKAQARAHSADAVSHSVDAVSLARAPEEAPSSEEPPSFSPRVALHISCHSRAQNMGRKAEELLRLIPDIRLKVVERCSGHGGSWGIMKENWQTGMRVGRLNFQQMNDEGRSDVIISECPLAGLHIEQGLEGLREGQAMPERLSHPVVLLARSYGWRPA